MTDLPGLRSLPEQGVERREPGIHLRTLNRVDDDIGGIRRAVTSLRGSPEPVVVIGGHQDEGAAILPGDLHRPASCLIQKFFGTALEGNGIDSGHGRILNKSDA